MTPRFSVVIPTRDRPDTLRHSLATCLDQEFGDYEILVCDNGTARAADGIVRELGSPRVRYLKAPRPLAMTDNWELAVSEARGDYMFVVGDDDGLMPYALRELDAIITRLGSKAVRWEAGFYTWPDVALTGQGNYLRLPLGRRLATLDADATIAAVIRFEAPYVRLPTFYNTAIHRSVVEELRLRVGRVFLSRFPDVYSGFAVGRIVRRYTSVGVPMSVAGLSSHSTGVANLFVRSGMPEDEDYRRLNANARLTPHPLVPDLPVFPEVPVADSFLYAQEALSSPADAPPLDRRLLLAHCLAATKVADSTASVAAMRASVADDSELAKWLDATLASDAVRGRPSIKVRPERFGFDGENLHLDTAPFGIANVRDAIVLAERIVRFRHRAVEYVDGEPARSG
jgi:glycosyltransferase involved in cell wall biosynthesis